MSQTPPANSSASPQSSDSASDSAFEAVPHDATPNPETEPTPTGETADVDDWQEWVDGGQENQENHDSPQAPTWTPILASTGPSPSPSGRLPERPLAMVETAFLASTTSLLWLINSYFPLGPIWRICFPIPIALVYLRWNRRAAWMATAVSFLLLTVFTGPVRSLFFLMPSGLLGMTLGFCWRRGASWSLSIFLGMIINTLGFFFRVALTSVLLNEDLWIYVTTQVTKLLNWVSVRLGLLFQPELSLVQVLAVVLVLINSVIYLLAVHLAAWFLLKRLGMKVPDPPEWLQVMLELEVDD